MLDVRVAVAAHKPYWMPADPMYVPVHAGAALATEPIPGFMRDDEGAGGISELNPHLSELTVLYWTWKQLTQVGDAPYAIGLVLNRRCLCKAGGMEALYDGDASFGAMNEDEAEFIGHFTQLDSRTAELSRGTVANGRGSIESGPQAGREEMASRYSHRKNCRVLETSMAGAAAEVQLGLRVTHQERRMGNRCSRRERLRR